MGESLLSSMKSVAPCPEFLFLGCISSTLGLNFLNADMLYCKGRFLRDYLVGISKSSMLTKLSPATEGVACDSETLSRFFSGP